MSSGAVHSDPQSTCPHTSHMRHFFLHCCLKWTNKCDGRWFLLGIRTWNNLRKSLKQLITWSTSVWKKHIAFVSQEWKNQSSSAMMMHKELPKIALSWTLTPQWMMTQWWSWWSWCFPSAQHHWSIQMTSLWDEDVELSDLLGTPCHCSLNNGNIRKLNNDCCDKEQLHKSFLFTTIPLGFMFSWTKQWM